MSRVFGLLFGACLAAALVFPMPMTQVPDPGIFVDATADAGIAFRHVNGATGQKRLPEVNGAGATFFDADGDGRIDLLLVQGAPWDDAAPAPTMALYRNRGAGKFVDATAGSGLDVRMYGFAAAPGDYDNDGDLDLYVTAFGPNRLFRNDGGRFVDVTAVAGVGHPGWGSAAAWIDYDGDGGLDLFAGNYLIWSAASDLYCSLDGVRRAYCNPRAYDGERSALFRNDGGRFLDVTEAAGLEAVGRKTLGATVVDYDRDGWADIALANDTEPDQLYANRGNGRFEEVGLMAGLALDEAGLARAGMGIDAADYRNDGRAAFAIGNFSNEMIGLYEQPSPGSFVDVARRSELGPGSLTALTFGLFFFDYNLDGRADLLAVNGHIYEDPGILEPGVTHEQRPLLYRNDGDGRLRDAGTAVGGPLLEAIAGRGAAHADIDGDGDLDVVVTVNGGRARLWRNLARDRQPSPRLVRLRLIGAAGRDAIGASATLVTASGAQTKWVKSGSSYLSYSEPTLTFGLAGAEIDALEVRWPGGNVSEFSAAELRGLVDRQVVIDEVAGIGTVITLAAGGR